MVVINFAAAAMTEPIKQVPKAAPVPAAAAALMAAIIVAASAFAAMAAHVFDVLVSIVRMMIVPVIRIFAANVLQTAASPGRGQDTGRQGGEKRAFDHFLTPLVKRWIARSRHPRAARKQCMQGVREDAATRDISAIKSTESRKPAKSAQFSQAAKSRLARRKQEPSEQ
jgi:hypothetical protein